MSGKKAVIIGAGYVGASIAYAMMLKQTAEEIVLIDVAEEKVCGEILDINHGIPYMGIGRVRKGGYEDCKDSSLIIITAGKNRRKDQTRMDLIKENSAIMKSIVDSIKPFYTDQVVLIVSNPVDALTYKVSHWLGDKAGRVFGTGCILDTSRLVSALSGYTGIGTDSINVVMVGEHGDCQMPVWSRATVANATFEEYCDQVGIAWDEEIKNRLLVKVHTMGADIIRRKERTHYGIATCVCYLADAVLNNHPVIAPVSSVLHGEYGINDVALSVPTIVNADGAAKRIEGGWTDDERLFLKTCAEKMREAVI